MPPYKCSEAWGSVAAAQPGRTHWSLGWKKPWIQMTTKRPVIHMHYWFILLSNSHTFRALRFISKGKEISDLDFLLICAFWNQTGVFKCCRISKVRCVCLPSWTLDMIMKMEERKKLYSKEKKLPCLFSSSWSADQHLPRCCLHFRHKQALLGATGAEQNLHNQISYWVLQQKSDWLIRIRAQRIPEK